MERQGYVRELVWGGGSLVGFVGGVVAAISGNAAEAFAAGAMFAMCAMALSECIASKMANPSH